MVATDAPEPEPTAADAAPSARALFKQLVHEHQTRLYRFIVKNIGYGSDAEELTQQVLSRRPKPTSLFAVRRSCPLGCMASP